MKSLSRRITSADKGLERQLNDLLAAVRRIRPRGSSTVRVSETESGTLLEAVVPPAGGGKPSSTAAGYFSVVSVGNFSTSCHSITGWSGTTPTIDSSKLITVSMPVDIWQNVASFTQGTTTWNYTYGFQDSNPTRIATSASASFTEKIIPIYTAGCIIFAILLPDKMGSGGATYQEISARAWALDQE